MKSFNTYKITEEYAGLKLGEYLRKKLLMSRNGLVKVKKSGTLRVNGYPAYFNRVLEAGDKVEFELPEKNSDNILPEYMELDIVFEDEYLLVVNKEAGIPTHPSRNHYMGTLANGLMYYLMDEGKDVAIRPVNRLDKNTSGLIIFAKNSHVHHLMAMEAYKSKIEKEYLAVVQGLMEVDSGTVDAPIAREREGYIKRVVREDGDRAVTHFKVISRYEDCSLLSIVLETGRTHQIRVHMAYLGHPLMGDELYGGSQDRIKRHALHAYRISMMHPVENRALEFNAQLPGDMRALVEGNICLF